MRTLILSVIISCLASSALISQVAFSARYLNNNSSSFDAFYNDQNVLTSGLEVGIGYWFRLKKVRMEFVPELSYTKFNSDIIDVSALNGQFNILIYPFDYFSDCGTCPTFSKEGGTVKKGFHWIVSPGFSMLSGSAKQDSLEDVPDVTTWRLGLGAGLDFGISNMLTIAPFAQYNLGGKYNLESEDTGRLGQWNLGIRATLRFDKDKW